MRAADRLVGPLGLPLLLPLLTFLSLLLPSLTANDSNHHSLDITPVSAGIHSANTTASWSLLSSPSTFLPTARYGHSSIALPSAILISHGYQYDHSTSSPVWLSDSWSFSLTTHRWHQLLPQCTDRQVVGGVCPCARMGATLVDDGERAYLYGGDDGGASRGQSSYTYNLFADLWSLPLAALEAAVADESSSAVQWQLEGTSVDSAVLSAIGYPASSSAAAGSVAHAQHTAHVRRRVADGASDLLVFGGMVPRAGETDTAADTTNDPSIVASSALWRLSLSPPSARQWQLMSCSGSCTCSSLRAFNGRYRAVR